MAKNEENKRGRPKSTVKKKSLNLSITASKIQKIKKKAIDEGIPPGQLVEKALDAFGI